MRIAGDHRGRQWGTVAVCHVAGEVILDHDGTMALRKFQNVGLPRGGHGRAGGVLEERLDDVDDSGSGPAERLLERVWLQAVVVHRDRHEPWASRQSGGDGAGIGGRLDATLCKLLSSAVVCCRSRGVELSSTRHRTSMAGTRGTDAPSWLTVIDG